MRTLSVSSLVVAVVLFAGCSGVQSETAQNNGVDDVAFADSLVSARKGFRTEVFPSNERGESVAVAPAAVFSTVKYPAPVGNLSAYVSPDPRDGKKHPAIVWITGGDCNSIGDVWSPQGRSNDQSAAAFRKAGVVMMFPSLRGGNNNPGVKEGFMGEVNDVLAAANWLSKLPYVDAKRVYLGGHSTGGTLALLVAEYSSRFRATFSFGPVGDVRGYGVHSGFLPFDTSVKNEYKLRSPGYWLDSVHSPTWVIEGTEESSNVDSLRNMREIAEELPANPNLHFVEVKGTSHFSVLAPVNELLARKVVADNGAVCNIRFSGNEVK